MSTAFSKLEENLFEVEKQLRDSVDSRQEVINQIKEIEQAVRKELDSGLPQEEFERMEKLRVACESAVLIVDRVWSSYHPD